MNSAFLYRSIRVPFSETQLEGIEIIGYAPVRKTYFGPFFDNQGSVGWEEIKREGATWIWNGENVMCARYHRCTAVFKNDKRMTAVHEHSDDHQKWHKWMDITLSKTDG